MEYRNPKYSTPDNTHIDVEMNHPAYGWIPYTADQAILFENTELAEFISQNPPAPYQE